MVTKTSNRMINGGMIHVADFGAVGDGVTDDAPAIQAAIDYAIAQGWRKSNADLGSGTYLGANPIVKFETKVYAIGTTINFPSNYDNVDFNRALFLPSASFDQSKFAFDMETWNCQFDRLRLARFKKGLNIHNNNLNIGVIRFVDLQASNVDKLFTITNRSSLTIVDKYRLDKVKIVAEILDGDKVVFEDGWLSAGTFDNSRDAHFIMNSATSPGLDLNKLFYVPSPQTASEVSVVKITNSAARVTLDQCLMGGEPGQIPLVNNFVSAVNTLGRGCHITINNSSGFTTGTFAAVTLYALPNSVVFNNYYGAIEQSHDYGLVSFNDAERTFEEAETLLGNARFEIHINGRTPTNFVGFPYADRGKLVNYDRSSPLYTRHYASQASTANPYVLLANNEDGLGVTYKAKIYTTTNNGADRYSEYVIASSTAPAPNGTWTVVPIIEGSSTVAARVRTNGSNDVEVVPNSSATTDFTILLESISNTDRWS